MLLHNTLVYYLVSWFTFLRFRGSEWIVIWDLIRHHQFIFSAGFKCYQHTPGLNLRVQTKLLTELMFPTDNGIMDPLPVNIIYDVQLFIYYYFLFFFVCGKIRVENYGKHLFCELQKAATCSRQVFCFQVYFKDIRNVSISYVVRFFMRYMLFVIYVFTLVYYCCQRCRVGRIFATAFLTATQIYSWRVHDRTSKYLLRVYASILFCVQWSK